jgi:hypothetical protein
MVKHQLLALVHVARSDDVAAPHLVLTVGEELGNDAGDLAAMVEHAVGKLAHQPDRAAAIDEADAVLGKRLAELSRGRGEIGIAARSGAAIDADSSDLGHSDSFVRSGMRIVRKEEGYRHARRRWRGRGPEKAVPGKRRRSLF